jgi:hypothetical protein
MPLINIVIEVHVISYYTVLYVIYSGTALRIVSNLCFRQVLTELCKEMKTTTELAVKVTHTYFLKNFLFLQFLTKSIN